jgi:hypothetical protein
MARVFFGGRGPPAPGLGTNIPVAGKSSCETGLRLIDGAVVALNTISRLGRMFIARLTGGLWHFWASGQAP